MVSPHANGRSQLRRTLRERRRALAPAARKKAARALARRLAALPDLRACTRIALYWPADGEIDTRAIRTLRAFSRHQFFLPVLRRFPPLTLAFVRWHGSGRLQRNRFGIPEPRGARHAARTMDAILLPLTGFDAAGNRLGMGGGFYDRTLAFKRNFPAMRPLLIGVAHACQQVDALPAAPWDVPLALVVTDRATFR